MAATYALPRQAAQTSFWNRKRKAYVIAFLFVAPALINFLIFRYFPIVSAVYISLWDYSLQGGFGDFLGFDNYARALFNDELFWNSMWVTALFTILKVPLQVALALALAILVQREIRGMGIVRSAIFTPVVTSIMVASILWAMLYHSQLGLFNSILATVGLPRISFLTDTKTALSSIAAMMIWKDVGFSMIILLAGMKGIPDVYYEAAKIDGANAWQQFKDITLPLLKRVMLFVIVTQTVGAFQVFAPVYAMTRGGPQDSTKVISYYIYENAFRYPQMGYASTLSVIVLIVILVISLVLMRVLRSDVEY